MTDEREDDVLPIAEADARWLLGRAAQLDAEESSHDNVGRLREAAHEAGISSAAFERALLEVRLAPPVRRSAKLSEITRRVFTNFLPGWLSTLIVPALVLKPSTFLDIGPIQIGLLTIAAAASVVGHAAALRFARTRDEADPRIADRLSFMAGALTPAAFVILQVTGVLRSPLQYDTTTLAWAAISAGLTLIGFGGAKLVALRANAKRVAAERAADRYMDKHDGPWARFVAISRQVPLGAPISIA